MRVVIMPNLQAEMKLERPSIFSEVDGSSRFFSLYGSAGAPPVEVLEKPPDDIVKLRSWFGWMSV